MKSLFYMQNMKQVGVDQNAINAANYATSMKDGTIAQVILQTNKKDSTNINETHKTKKVGFGKQRCNA